MMAIGWKPPKRGEEMLAIHQSNPKIIHSSRKNEQNGYRWKPPRRGRDASCPSIKPESIIHQGKIEIMATGWKPPRRRGDANYPSIKPEKQLLNKEKGKNGQRKEIS
jgi:hypothetical protein